MPTLRLVVHVDLLPLTLTWAWPVTPELLRGLSRPDASVVPVTRAVVGGHSGSAESDRAEQDGTACCGSRQELDLH